jgi:hypothetical protein
LEDIVLIVKGKHILTEILADAVISISRSGNWHINL